MASPSPSPLASLFPSSLPTYPPLDIGGATSDLPIWSYLFQLTLVTGVLAFAAYYGVRILRDKVPGLGLQLPGVGRNLRVVDRTVVDASRMVFIVAVGKRYWLLAATSETVTSIAELSREDVEADVFANLVERENKSS